MKTTLLVLIGCISLFAYGYAFSCGGGCGSTQSDCQQSNCTEAQDYCQCADVNAGKNPCISKSDYCRLFGNAGDNQLPDWPDNN